MTHRSESEVRPATIQVTKEVLEGIGAGNLRSLLILNKIDAADISQKALLKKEFPVITASF